MRLTRNQSGSLTHAAELTHTIRLEVLQSYTSGKTDMPQQYTRVRLMIRPRYRQREGGRVETSYIYSEPN